MDLDEEERLKEEEAQQKEIQALLLKEFDDIDINEQEDENENYSSDENNALDESRIDINNSSNDSNEKENFLRYTAPILNPTQPKWNFTDIRGFYAENNFNGIYCHNNQGYQQTNNNFSEMTDNSKTWEISLHGEMGLPQTGLSNGNRHEFAEQTCHQESTIAPQRLGGLVPSSEPPLRKITRDVGVECVPINQRQLDNLELLYDARGRRIEQLQTEVDAEREKRIRETRVVGHRASLLQAELDNRESQLHSLTKELEAARAESLKRTNESDKTQARLLGHENELSAARETIAARDVIVETLTAQVADLRLIGCGSRREAAEEELLVSVSRAHDSELGRVRARLAERTTELERMETLLDEQSRLHADWRKQQEEERAEVSHQRERELERRLVRLNVERLTEQDVAACLQEEVDELSRQLSEYEETLCLIRQEAKLPDTAASLTRCVSEPDINIAASCQTEVRDRLAEAMLRTASLASQLLQQRRCNLDSHTELRRLQCLLDENSSTSERLQNENGVLKRKLLNLQNGEETECERRLKEAVSSLELVKNNLDQQCKMLTEQLKTTEQKVEAREDDIRCLEATCEQAVVEAVTNKEAALTEVRHRCDVHYQNLRHQLELNAAQEKRQLQESETQQRVALETELDRVKSLYIELSQQTAAEESEEWQQWLSNRLAEQKRSLTRQFQNDRDLLVRQLEEQHRFQLDKVAPVRDTLVDRACQVSCRELAAVYVQTDDVVLSLESQWRPKGQDVAVQTICDIMNKDEGCQTLVHVDDSDGCDPRQQLRMDFATQTEENYEADRRYEELLKQYELLALSSDLNDPGQVPWSVDPTGNHHNQNPTRRHHLPSIIRSTTPTLVRHGRPNSTSENKDPNQESQERFYKEFVKLKTEMVDQFQEISKSVENIKSSRLWQQTSARSLPPIQLNSSSSYSWSASAELMAQLQSQLLQSQGRAALTLQRELERGRCVVRRSLMLQLSRVLPLTLAVDARLLHIEPAKVKLLTKKLTIALTHLLDIDDDADGGCEYSDEAVPPAAAVDPAATSSRSSQSSLTERIASSTPRPSRQHMVSAPRFCPLSITNSSSTSSLISAAYNPTISTTTKHQDCGTVELSEEDIRTETQRLEEDISRLSRDLAVTSRPTRLFDHVDSNSLLYQPSGGIR